MWLVFFLINVFTLSIYSSSVNSQQLYFPIETHAQIKSIQLNSREAHLIMHDKVNLHLSLKVMKGTRFNRAYAVTPEGMRLGFKYTDDFLQLLAIDKKQENYMMVVLNSTNAKKVLLNQSYLKPILADTDFLSSVQFLQSYAIWPPNSISRGFDLLSVKEQKIIQFFPAIRVDIAEKLCRADGVTSALFSLLDNKISCDSLSFLSDKKIYADKLNSLIAIEMPLAIKVIECAQGRHHLKFCQKINKHFSEKIIEADSLMDVLKVVKY